MDNLLLEIQINRLKEMRAGFERSDPTKAQLIKQYITDLIFTANACNMALLSHCVSKQVGCQIVRDGRTLSTGINGTIIGDDNCDSLFPATDFDPVAHREWADQHEIHAEMNAINFAAKFGISLNESTLYCSLQPCNECSKNIPAAGIRRIVFSKLYPRVKDFTQQIVTLGKRGVIIEKLKSFDEFLIELQ